MTATEFNKLEIGSKVMLQPTTRSTIYLAGIVVGKIRRLTGGRTDEDYIKVKLAYALNPEYRGNAQVVTWMRTHWKVCPDDVYNRLVGGN